MANEQNRCFIWGTPVEQTIRYPDWDIPSEVRGSPRTGGNYSITFQAINYVGTLDDSQRARLTTLIIEERRKTGQTPLVTPKLIEDAKRADPLPVYTFEPRDSFDTWLTNASSRYTIVSESNVITEDDQEALSMVRVDHVTD